MNKKDIVEEKPYPITISDWLFFLESNTSTNLSLYVLLGSFLIAIMISVIGLGTSFTFYSLIGTFIMVIFLIVIILVLRDTTKQIKNYQNLSQRIILGEITDPKDVRSEYNKFKKEIKKYY